MSSTSLTNWRNLHGDKFAGKRVLLTGGAGFIGSHLAHALSELGANVAVLDDLSGSTKENNADLPKLEMIEGSILDEPLLKKAMNGAAYVFHLAAKGSVPQSVAEPRLYNDVNTGGTLNVLEAARAANVKRIVYSASSSAYGDSLELPKRETMPPHACSPYAATKLAGESLLSAYSYSYNLDTASLRYFNVFGPRQNANSAYAAVIAAFAAAMFAGKRPKIFGDGEQSRDFTYVDNVVHANLLAASNPTPVKGAIVNVGCGTRVSVNDLAMEMAKILNRPDLTPIYEPERAGDVKHSLADLSIGKQTIGYAPIVSFADGLKPTLAWYQANTDK